MEWVATAWEGREWATGRLVAVAGVAAAAAALEPQAEPPHHRQRD